MFQKLAVSTVLDCHIMNSVNAQANPAREVAKKSLFNVFFLLSKKTTIPSPTQIMLEPRDKYAYTFIYGLSPALSFDVSLCSFGIRNQDYNPL